MLPDYLSRRGLTGYGRLDRYGRSGGGDNRAKTLTSALSNAGIDQTISEGKGEGEGKRERGREGVVMIK